MRSAPIGAVCLLYTAVLGAASASEPAREPASTTTAPAPLRSALRDIWDSSPDLQAAQADRAAARARAEAAAQPLYNPSLALDAENADVDRRTAGISLPLDLSGKRRARTEQGEAERRASENDYALRRRDIAARWLKAWSTAALAARQSELGRRRLALMQRLDDLAARRLKVGDISSPERDLAGLALGEAQMQQAALAGNEAAARATLVAISGDHASQLPALPASLPPASETWTPRPAAQWPELMQARAEQASAEAGVHVARRARIPDPTVSLTGGQVRNGALSDRVVGLSVSIPLPVLNSGGAEVAAAQAEADAAVAKVRSRQFALDAHLAETRARYDALHAAAGSFHDGRAAAFDERTALLEKLWRAGEIGTSDYLVQLKQSLDTALSGLQLESQAWQAWFDYLTAAGRLTDWIDGRTQDVSP
jgi:cobalt-zinc-cadmium efflux system outer membrane protein